MDWKSNHEMWELVRAEWGSSKSNTICALMGNCDCPGDENGADPEQAICFKVEKMIDEWMAMQKSDQK